MADYDVLLDGMTAASQTTAAPELAMRLFISPDMPTDGLRARRAPLGLRMIEAALLSAGHGREDVGVVAPEQLPRAVGSATRVLLVSSGDPLGHGMNDSTMSGLGGGRPYTAVRFERLMGQVRTLKARHPALRVVLGGAGAWQLEGDETALRNIGIDVLVCGYAERMIAGLIADLLAGRPVGPVVHAPVAPQPPTDTIAGPTSMGVVEVSRGCGLGCPFCTVGTVPMVHLPVAQIVENVKVNVRGKVRSQCLISEDFLRYGARGARLDPPRVLEMAEAVRAVPGVRLIQLDHVNVCSVAQFPGEALHQLHAALVRGQRHEFLWVNIGVETASGALLARGACRGKMHPFEAADWERVSEDAVERLIAAEFVPMVSLMFGLPGETEEDIAQTLRFVERLSGKRLVIFPLFLAPVEATQRAFTMAQMTPLYWRLLRRCYAFNFKWLPALYADNQIGAHVHWLRRLAVQLGGRARIMDWRLRFAARSALA